MAHIAIDFDDVLVNTNEYIIDKYNEQFGTNFNQEQFTQWDYSSEMGVDKRILGRFIDNVLLAAQPGDLETNVDVLDALYDLRHLHAFSIVSARHANHFDFMRQWAINTDPTLFSYIVCTNQQPKGPFIAHLGMNALLDDSPEHVDSCYALGIPAVIYDRPHNRQFDAVHRAYTGADIVRLFSPKE